LRPGRLDRIIYVPPPDAESRRKILEVYTKDMEEKLSPDVKINELELKTKWFSGADIEALVREAKISAMRDIIGNLKGKSPQERQELLKNKLIERRNFDVAFTRVKPSFDPDTLEESERRSWEMIFNAEEKRALETALSILKRADLASTGLDSSDELVKGMEDLRLGIFARYKDWEELRGSMTRLEKVLEKR
jgi:transitional endoplasmic reticulum ATPase